MGGRLNRNRNFANQRGVGTRDGISVASSVLRHGFQNIQYFPCRYFDLIFFPELSFSVFSEIYRQSGTLLSYSF